MTNKAFDMILAERQRQFDTLGYTAEHDDQYTQGELLRVAVMYSQSAVGFPLGLQPDGRPTGFPWDARHWKPKGPVRDLVRAGALCLAERARVRRMGERNTNNIKQKFDHIRKLLDNQLDLKNA